MQQLSRRRFLASTAALGAVATAPSLLASGAAARSAPLPALRAGTRVIEVDGRAASVFGLTAPNGHHGLSAQAGERLRLRLENLLDEHTLIHWHGLTPPWQQDGVPGLSQPPHAPGEAYHYDFMLDRPGTNWMHPHHGLQEERLLSAPLIVRDPRHAGADEQEVVVLFHDFSFRDPEELLAELRRGGYGAGHAAASHGPGAAHGPPPTVTPDTAHGAGHAGMQYGTTDHAAMGHAPAAGAGAVHLHDIAYDAFLANDRTLDDPQVFRVERGGRVRLRLINGAAATNFWLDLDRLQGRLVAVDGIPGAPIVGRRFEFAIAQRLDIELQLPSAEGAWPIFAVREGERARTGFVLATPTAPLGKLPTQADEAAAAVGLDLERRLRAAQPLPARSADRRHTIAITEAPGYVWMLNGAVHGSDVPLEVRASERVEITFADHTSMAHPMHLHGHHFQVVAIDGERFAGAMRDTVLVPARGSVTVAFDADNPGRWALHCHHLYHMAGGMMMTLEYPG